MFPSYPPTMPPMPGNQFANNPYLERLNALQSGAQQAPAYQIIHVSGEPAARSFRMAPNSQCLLLDDTAPIVWLATTDGTGYPSLTPYTITPYQAAPTPDPANMDERLKRLEALIYGKPDSASAPAAAGTDTNVGTKPAEHDAAVPTVQTGNVR